MSNLPEPPPSYQRKIDNDLFVDVEGYNSSSSYRNEAPPQYRPRPTLVERAYPPPQPRTPSLVRLAEEQRDAHIAEERRKYRDAIRARLCYMAFIIFVIVIFVMFLTSSSRPRREPDVN